MQRNLLGIVALVLLLSGGIGLVMGYSADSHAGMAAGVGMRAGLVLGALWIAYPQLLQMIKAAPKWLMGVGIILALVLVVNKNGLMLVVPALLLIGLLYFASSIFKAPAGKGKPRRRANRPPDKTGEVDRRS